MTAEPPVVCRGADLFVFALPAELRRLRDFCHSLFNEPTHGAVKCDPLGPWIVMIVGAIDRVSGANKDKPAVREKNVLVHVPVFVRTAQEDFPAVFSPYVWVDNPNSLTSGREVFGYAKTMGRITIDHPADPLCFELAVFGGNLNTDIWDWRESFLRIERGKAGAAPLFSIIDLVEGGNEVGDLLSKWADTGVRELYYKQFRSIDDGDPSRPGKACLTEIAAAEYVVFGEPKITPLGHQYKIHLDNLGSHPIRTELGLKAESVSWAYRLKTNFRLEHGCVLWTSR
jgi:hypothetical protein